MLTLNVICLALYPNLRVQTTKLTLLVTAAATQRRHCVCVNPSHVPDTLPLGTDVSARVLLCRAPSDHAAHWMKDSSALCADDLDASALRVGGPGIQSNEGGDVGWDPPPPGRKPEDLDGLWSTHLEGEGVEQAGGDDPTHKGVSSPNALLSLIHI